ncbi:amino acid ABC transporter permease [Siculibacillus lacustris]|uniref:Amino acid ABC transporter permease n=1 Tax=Siculibacillus lacustris TaxID=1549641 RepID=A0A4Q9VBT9_9HYPH|nr:amino acid ABC transporter permease [Siculibacillus lacustris]TBW31665.1 amino acid ABC transporter permease [Siculibacillus lacustris]
MTPCRSLRCPPHQWRGRRFKHGSILDGKIPAAWVSSPRKSTVYGRRVVRAIISAYVEFIRNTPFLIQVFVVYLGLPSLGVRLSPEQAAILAMTINVGAYGSEILRAGIESVPRGQIEAAKVLGFRFLPIFRHVIFRQALLAIYPALTSQFILLMLGTSIVSAIAVEELTAAANTIQTRTFRTFEVYFIVTLIYVAMSLFLRATFNAIYNRWIRIR